MRIDGVKHTRSGQPIGEPDERLRLSLLSAAIVDARQPAFHDGGTEEPLPWPEGSSRGQPVREGWGKESWLK